jgi:protein-tyrosine kinase
LSRIHEALKRAQEERAAQGNRSTLPPLMELPPVENGIVPEALVPAATADTAPVAAQEAVVDLGAPAFSPALTDTILQACVQSEWHPDLHTMLFFNPDERAAGTEEFRTLRSSLHQLREKMPLKKILVTSALPQEGKSFVAANLAQVLVRQPGRKALLIDADLRAAHLHEALGASSAPGVSEYLLRENDEVSILQRSSMENLFFIPCGRPISSPAELIVNGRLEVLLQRLEPLFDWIIIDSPAALVPDVRALLTYCDGVLMVVRSKATPADAAKRARLEFGTKPLLGVVMNAVDGPVVKSRPMSAASRAASG